MFNFKNFLLAFKKNKNNLDYNLDYNKEIVAQYKFARKMAYIKSKYPNFPNSDYVRLLEKEREKY
ncbi:MAG: hypothetical protein J6C55_03730 [Oscillospiraceae bacterium]|nr:hypothetical protein [Oscillospiraceae bacterium]